MHLNLLKEDAADTTIPVGEATHMDYVPAWYDAAHAASEITDDEPTATTIDRIEAALLRWLTPGRFWGVYGALILGSLLGAWWLA